VAHNEHLDNTDNKSENEVMKVGKPILLLLVVFGSSSNVMQRLPS
jgi:hypothetical protein